MGILVYLLGLLIVVLVMLFGVIFGLFLIDLFIVFGLFVVGVVFVVLLCWSGWCNLVVEDVWLVVECDVVW